MACRHIRIGPDTIAIICGRGGTERRAGCSSCLIAKADRLCDFPLGQSGRTCDKPLCPGCAAPWPLDAPVQLDPAYREKHGLGDLCRVHDEMVSRGRGPGLLALAAALRRGPASGRLLADALEGATLLELPAVLAGAIAKAEAFGSAHPDDPRLHRLAALSQAMCELKASLAGGGPAEVWLAEQRALAALPR